jgi:FAD-linked sulfhydryl oxidase
MVNARLGKPEFDCARLDETYDCGCGDEPLSATGDSQRKEDDRHPEVGIVKGG